MSDLVHTAMFFAGMAGLTYGSWLAWEPAGYLVPSLIMLALVVRARSLTSD